MEIDWSEHYIKKGDSTLPTYYIIRRKEVSVGLFSNVHVFMGHIWYALSKGYIPVIDMQNYYNAYLPPELLGKENSWEYYFCQPFGVNLEQAMQGENILLSNGEPIKPSVPGDLSLIKNGKALLIEWQTLLKIGLLKIKPTLQKEIDDLHKKIFPSGEKVLGVILRGSDYSKKKPYNHPIPPPGICSDADNFEDARMELHKNFSCNGRQRNF